MGGRVIAGILERYIKDPRHTRSGFPDLTLWNTENKTFKVSLNFVICTVFFQVFKTEIMRIMNLKTL